MFEEPETINDQPPNDSPDESAPKPQDNTKRWIAVFVILTVCCWGAAGAALLSAGVFTVPSIMAGQQATQVQIMTQTQQALATETNVASVVNAASQWPVVAFDSFATNDRNWDTISTQREDGTIDLAVEDDKYHWELDLAQGFWIPAGTDIGPVTDFYASVEFEQLQGPDDVFAGIIFRYDSQDGLYYFGVDRRGETSFGLFYNNRWTRTETLKSASAFLNDTSNRIAVLARGSQFAFFINDELVGEIEDDRLPYGPIGLAASQPGGAQKVILEFDNFEVRTPIVEMAYASTATAVSTAAADYLQGTIVFSDIFNFNEYDWHIGRDDSAYSEGILLIKDGKYRWSVKALQGVFESFMADAPIQTNFFYSAEAQKTSGTADARYGLVFRRRNGNYYFFGINDQRDLFVSLKSGGEWQSLLRRNLVSAIRPGEINTLGVLADGPYLAFFINDQYVGEVENASLESGEFGLAIDLNETGDEIDVEFDNLEVRTSRSVITPTPTVQPTLPFTAQGHIVYSSAQGIAYIEVENPNPTWITRVSSDKDPSWSPTSKNIIFSRPDNTYNLFTVAIDGKNEKSFVSIVGDESEPVWSPTGDFVAYVSTYDNGLKQIVLAGKRDGNNNQQLTFSPGSSSGPAWSPDNALLAYVTHQADHYSLNYINLDTKEVTTVLDSTNPIENPDWSPDGEWIVFTFEHDGNQEIYRIQPEGDGLAQLTTNSSDDFDAVWSPDGQFIAFVSRRDGSPEIYLMKADGTLQTRLTYSTAAENDLDWGP